MKRLLLVLCLGTLLTLLISKAHAQYTSAVGGRAGKFASGIDIKHFFDARSNVGIQLFGGFTREANGGWMTKGYFVKQLPIFNSMLQIPVDIVFGVGGHAGLFRDRYYRIESGNPLYYDVNTLAAGVDAMFALEYNTRKLPFTVGLDVNPYYSLLNPGPEWLDVGITVRFKIQ
ncbi:MAG: hypothetical protein IT242_02145 [Bacteroidia bacterium]|nr:hypothetical protein [Bacteroidia bacterium]